MESRTPGSTEKPEAAKSAWVPYTDPTTKAKVVIHRDWFEQYGIVVLAANSGYRAPVQSDAVTIEDRNLRVGAIDTNSNKKQTNQASSENGFNPNPGHLRKVISLRNFINNYNLPEQSSGSKLPTKETVIYNTSRREEIFVPVGRAIPTFANFWLSSPSEFKEFDGFSYFITAGCMFGSSLKGHDQRNGSYPLIKHFFKTFDEQVFDELSVDGHFPYEDDLVRKDKALALFAKQFAKKDKKPVVFYHLPYYDYILFAAQLFIHGQTTLEVFGSFCTHILEKKHELSSKIKHIYNKQGVEVIIESPFENLFSKNFANTLIERFKLANKDHETTVDMNDSCDALSKEIIIAKLVLKELNLYDLIDESNINGKITSKVQTAKEQETRERDFVQHCIEKLRLANADNPQQAEVWCDFLDLGLKDKTRKQTESSSSSDQGSSSKQEPTTASESSIPIPSTRKATDLKTIEELFTVANPVLLGKASLMRGTDNSKAIDICSFLPVSEKPIQIGYADFAKRHESNFHNKKYVTLLNVTTMENCLSFSQKNRGLIFYNLLDPTCLATLTAKGLLKAAQVNRSLASSSCLFQPGKQRKLIDDVVNATPVQRKKLAQSGSVSAIPPKLNM
jgi:hypothetical protein